MSLDLVLLADVYAVCRLEPEAGPVRKAAYSA